MRIKSFILIAAIGVSAGCEVYALADDSLKPQISTEDVGRAVAPYYDALKRGDWRVVSDYCILTANSTPKRYYYDSRASSIDAAATWSIRQQYPVVYADPITGLVPEISMLVVGAFQTSHLIETPDSSASVNRIKTFKSLDRITMDVWLRDKGQWRIIPEHELHMNAIHLDDLPYSGTGVGKQFDQLAEIEAQAKNDRDKSANLRLQAEKQMADYLKIIQPVLQDKSLTVEEKRAALEPQAPTEPPIKQK